MAKYEKRFKGDFNGFLDFLDDEIIRGSASASFEDGSDVTLKEAQLAVRVYERYSMFGGNRVSLNVTLLGEDDQIFISAITSGGSQAVFLKVNTLGEESFLNKLEEAVEAYLGKYT
jgi:hypothetical protein